MLNYLMCLIRTGVRKSSKLLPQGFMGYADVKHPEIIFKHPKEVIGQSVHQLKTEGNFNVAHF